MNQKKCLSRLFGKALKEQIQKGMDRAYIGGWAFSFHFRNIGQMNDALEDLVMTLATMELGEEFFFSYEKLDQIADELIAGKEVHLK